MPKLNPAAVRETAEKVLAKNPKVYAQFLFTLQGAERPVALMPLVMQILSDVAEVASRKPHPKLLALEPPDDLPLFSGDGGGLGGAMMAKSKPAETPSRYSTLVKATATDSGGTFLVPQGWVDAWAQTYQGLMENGAKQAGSPQPAGDAGLLFVEGCLLAALDWNDEQPPNEKKTARGMRMFLGKWMRNNWSRGGGRRTAGVAAVGANRSPSRLGKSNETMKRLVAEAVATGNIEEMPF